MLKYQTAAKNIKELFDKELNTFDSVTQRHYAERMYRISGEAKYIDYLVSFFSEKKEKIDELISIIDNTEAINNYGIEVVERGFKRLAKDSKKLPRLAIYQTIPEYKYYFHLLWYMDKLKDYNITPLIHNYDEILNKLKKVDFKKYLFNKDLVMADPVQTINNVFHLENLGIANLSDEYIDIIKTLFDKVFERGDLVNKLYSYTHILLSESGYYQKFIETNKYNWIYEYFDQNIKQILELNNLDLIAEIGVCYKLKRINNNSSQAIMEKIFNELKEDGYLKRKEGTLANAEHRNVLAIILFSDIKYLHKGPNLNKLLNL